MKITFYRTALNSTGDFYKASLQSFEFPDSLSQEEATRRAIADFQTNMNVPHWQEIAHTCEVS